MKNIDPYITIITVVFNGQYLIEKTIQSVVNQNNKKNIQYIIIDGASEDVTLDIINKYEKKIDILISEKDDGIYDAMNKGIKYATGEWIYFLNAGDTLDSLNMIENIKLASLSKIADVIYGDFNLIYSQRSIKKLHKTKEFINIDFLQKSTICHQALIFRTELFRELGGYNLKYEICSDYDKLLQIFLAGKVIKKIDLTICNYLDGGISSKHYIKSALERLKIIKYRLNHSKLYYIIYQYITILRAFLYSIRKIKK